MKNILNSFPHLEDLPEFYLKLLKITLDYAKLKKSLGGVAWALRKNEYFYNHYKAKIKRTGDLKKINVFRREYYGRVSSVLRQIKVELEILEQARQVMKNYPAIKTSLKTVCLFGFPNVGKSTLLAKITEAKPEIKNYAFTTKSLNMGYLKTDREKIQFIDTPGTLDRFFKMNPIEQQANLALKHCCDVVVYVFDLTESFSFENQFKLFENMQKMRPELPVLVYLSKTDIVEKAIVDNFSKDFKKKYSKIKITKDKDALVKNIFVVLK